MNPTAEQLAREGFEIVVKNLEAVCPHLKRKFAIQDKDCDGLTFTIDGYPFTLSWEPTTRKGMGRDYEVPQYTLSISYVSQRGDYWTPPEYDETNLVETQFVHECITCALESVAKDEIRQCLEGVGYELIAGEEE